MSHCITLTLNGERRDLAGPTTVALLLMGLGFDRRKVAVERNNALVPRALYDATELAPGDAVEIVHFLGG